MLKKHLAKYKPHFRHNETHIHAAVIVTVMAFIGFVGVYGVKAATFAVNTEAENGTLSGNAVLTGDATASGGNSVAFGKNIAPTTPSELKTFTGGASIALRWTGTITNSALFVINTCNGSASQSFNFPS